MPTDWRDVPGRDFVSRGLRDLHAGHLSAEALLVAIGGPRLQRLAIAVRDVDSPELEHRLYDSLPLRGSDAHSQDNALTPRLVSFERALERESERTATG